MIDVIGVGAEGAAALPPTVQTLLDEAEVVVGGERHLAMLEPRAGREARPWPSPLKPALPGLLSELAGRRLVVLASGDPLVSGIGSTLIGLLGADAVRIHPAVSSEALARARMGWGAEDSVVVTLVGRAFDRLRRYLSPRARLVVLTSGADAPARIAGILVEEGYVAGRLTVLGDLGAAAESRLDGVAGAWAEVADVPVPRLHLVCVDCRPSENLAAEQPGGPPRSLVPGLPDDAYAHDGQLTKRVVRTAALAHLAPQPGDVMWDLGAGSGSVGIEFARQHPRNRVHAAERSRERADRVRTNAIRLGVPDLVVTVGDSEEAIGRFPDPDAVFIGGGASMELIGRAWQRLRPGGRLVAHGVTVETESILVAASGRWGGTLARIQVEDLEPLGRLRGWRPHRAVTQWSVRKSVLPQPDPEEPA